MRFRIVFCLLSVMCMVSCATGCQSGKFNMPKLAFWKANDQIDSDYLEPPSQKFTPERTAVADSVSRLDKGDGPPARPETASTNDESLDAFAEEVNRSWEELSEKTRSAENGAAQDVNRAPVDLANVSMPPARENGDDFKQPLTPRYVSSGTTSTSIAENNGSFSPLSPKASTAPSTRYEQIAQTTIPTTSPVTPPATSTNGAGDFAPWTESMPKVTSPRTPLALQPQSTLPQIAAVDGEPSRMQNPYTPGLQPDSTKAAPVPGQSDTGGALATSGTPAHSYESTPYKPFVARNESTSSDVMAASHSGSSSPPAQVSQIPITLNLSGQGTYAPGSVRRPSPLIPENLTATPQSGGGSFLR